MKKIWNLIVILVIAVGMIGCGDSSSDSGNSNKSSQDNYKDIVKKYFKAIEDNDAELRCSLMADDYLNYLRDAWDFTDEELIDNYQEMLDKYHSECGDTIKTSYSIKETHTVTDQELEELNKSLQDYDFEENSVKKAVVVDVQFTLQGDKKSKQYSNKLLIMKVKDKWCLPGGELDLSWY